MNRVSTLSTPRHPHEGRTPAAQFLFSGRGPLRNAQIEALQYRTRLLVAEPRAFELGETLLRG